MQTLGGLISNLGSAMVDSGIEVFAISEIHHPEKKEVGLDL